MFPRRVALSRCHRISSERALLGCRLLRKGRTPSSGQGEYSSSNISPLKYCAPLYRISVRPSRGIIWPENCRIALWKSIGACFRRFPTLCNTEPHNGMNLPTMQRLNVDLGHKGASMFKQNCGRLLVMTVCFALAFPNFGQNNPPQNPPPVAPAEPTPDIPADPQPRAPEDPHNPPAPRPPAPKPGGPFDPRPEGPSTPSPDRPSDHLPTVPSDPQPSSPPK